jgi:hypothetical protein
LRKVAIVDACASKFPKLFAEKVAEEVASYVRQGKLPYPNLRYSGSGELREAHLPALLALKHDHKIVLWGFTRNLNIAAALKSVAISAIFSCDRATPPDAIRQALRLGLSLAYTSTGVDDNPPAGTSVTFPLHRGGRVSEVVDSITVCPKVLSEYLSGHREEGTCQAVCQRCHTACEEDRL